MATRMRSPNYPSIPLNQAIGFIEKIYSSERANVVDREVAAIAMGYTGITGRSAKILSDLIQYGLLEKGGKNEVRVTSRSVDILHPDSAESKVEALRSAAIEPELFQRVAERFPAGRPSDAALKSFFLREGFTDAAIPPARRAYMETFQYVEDTVGTESNWFEGEDGVESVSNQPVETGEIMKPSPIQNVAKGQQQPQVQYPQQKAPLDEPGLNWVGKKLFLSGVISNKQQAQEAIDFISAVMGFMREAPRDAGSENPPEDPTQ